MRDDAVGIPLVTPAGWGAGDAEVAPLVAELVGILTAGRYRVGDGFAAEAARLLAQELNLPSDWRVVTFRSGTDALARALAGYGIRAGHRVGVPDLAYHAVCGVVLMAGATPVALDVRGDDWNLDPRAVGETVESLDAVIAVDNYGTPCDRVTLGELCRQAGVPLILDACESLGSAHPDGGPASSVDAVAVSFSFTKPVHAAGAGGALAVPAGVAERILASEEILARQVQLPELNAAALVHSWPKLTTNVLRLRQQYRAYRELLEPMGLQAQVEHVRGTRLHAPFLLPNSVSAESRGALVDGLARAGIEARPMFPSQSRLLGLGEPPPVSAQVDRRVLCLPTGAGLAVTEVAGRAASVIEEWLDAQTPATLTA